MSKPRRGESADTKKESQPGWRAWSAKSPYLWAKRWIAGPSGFEATQSAILPACLGVVHFDLRFQVIGSLIIFDHLWSSLIYVYVFILPKHGWELTQGQHLGHPRINHKENAINRQRCLRKLLCEPRPFQDQTAKVCKSHPSSWPEPPTNGPSSPHFCTPSIETTQNETPPQCSWPRCIFGILEVVASTAVDDNVSESWPLNLCQETQRSWSASLKAKHCTPRCWVVLLLSNSKRIPRSLKFIPWKAGGLKVLPLCLKTLTALAF